MMLHIDASRHQWFCDDRWHDLIVVLDDATSEIYDAQLVAEESTRTVMAALRSVAETKGWFSSIYSDRASHFFRTPKAGQPVDTREVTEVGRAMRDLGIRMIPAYSPQARGRSERNFGTWQGRLPQELRLKQLHTPEQANAFLRDHYIGEFNSKFMVAAAETGTAFAPIHRQDLDRVFAIQQERTVANDNTIQFANHVWQIPSTPFRATLAGCRVIVYEHLDATFSVGYGPHTVGRFTASGEPVMVANASGRNRSSPEKTSHGRSRLPRRTWPINQPGAKKSPKAAVRAQKKAQRPPAARRSGWARTLPLRPKTLRPSGSAGATLQRSAPSGTRGKEHVHNADRTQTKSAGT